MKNKGTLILCATPIGNLEDISLRAIRVLNEADYVLAEDTRHTLKLLNHLEIKKPLISYHEYSKVDKEDMILGLMEEGKDLVLVSDAGMPGISDPGERLVRLAWERDFLVTIVPGPSAGISALAISGFPSSRFVFEGFLPKSKKDRRDRLEELKQETRTLVLYVPPHGLLDTLKELLEFLGDRQIALVRELTKKYEEVKRLSLSQSIEYYTEVRPKGEFVLVIEGGKRSLKVEEYHDLSIHDHLYYYLSKGFTKKEAVEKVAEDRKLPKNYIYKESLKLDEKSERR